MYKSKSILLLASFTSEEIRSFSSFVSSPYFNTNTRVTKLFNELKKYHPDFTSKGVSKENLFKKLFPGKEYNEQVMKNLISELLRLEKEFIAVNGFRNNKFQFSLELISGLTSRSAEPITGKEISTLKEILKDKELVSDQINLFSHLLEEKVFSYFISVNNQANASVNIETSGEQLTFYFLKTIFRLSMNNHINTFSFNNDIERNFPDMIIRNIDLPKFLDYLESINNKEATYLKLSYFALEAIKKADEDVNYRNFHDLLFSSINDLTKGDLKLFLHFMESLCAQKINSGRTVFYRDLFDTFDFQIKHNLYNTDLTQITVLKFRNIVLSAIRTEEYDWAEKFIHDFRNKLQKENRKNVVELALAQLNFARGNFNETLEHLNKIKTDQVYFKIDVRSLNLMTLFELGYYESAISLIESFKKLLNNNPIFTEQYSRKNMNFINSVNSLIRLKIDSDQNGINELKSKVNSFDVISNKKWLLQKFDNFETM